MLNFRFLPIKLLVYLFWWCFCFRTLKNKEIFQKDSVILHAMSFRSHEMVRLQSSLQGKSDVLALTLSHFPLKFFWQWNHLSPNFMRDLSNTVIMKMMKILKTNWWNKNKWRWKQIDKLELSLTIYFNKDWKVKNKV